MSAIILEREVLNVWNDCGILNSIVHDRVVSGLVVTLEQAVKQEWPALKSLLRSINLVAKSFFQWLRQNLLFGGSTIALSGRVTSNSDSDLVIFLWWWNLEVVFETWKLCLLCLQVGLIVALLGKLNLEFAQLLLKQGSLWCLSSQTSSNCSLLILKGDVLLPCLQVDSRFHNQVDSLLKSFVVGQFHVDILCENTIAFLVWMDWISHRILVLHLNELLSVNDIIHGNTGIDTDFLNQSSNIGLGFYPWT